MNPGNGRETGRGAVGRPWRAGVLVLDALKRGTAADLHGSPTVPLLQGMGRRMGMKAQRTAAVFLPQSWGARGTRSRADEGKKLQGQETPSGPRPRERLGPRGPPRARWPPPGAPGARSREALLRALLSAWSRASPRASLSPRPPSLRLRSQCMSSVAHGLAHGKRWRDMRECDSFIPKLSASPGVSWG